MKKYALPAAAIAAVVVLSGTSGAVATSLITGAQIEDGTITSADVANGNLTGTDLKDGTVGGVDLRDGSVGGTDLKDGTVGGADLTDGGVGLPDLAPSARGLRNLGLTETSTTGAPEGNLTHLTFKCPTGKVLVSATSYWEQSSRAIQVIFHSASAEAYSYGSDYPDDTIHLQLMCAAQG